MSFTDAADARDRELLATNGAARQPATLGDAWSAQWDAAGLSTPGGVMQPLGDASDELAARISAVTGQDRQSFAGDAFSTGDISRQADALQAYAQGLPQPQQDEIGPDLIDVHANAARKAQAIEARAAQASAGTYGLAGRALGWIAGTARVLADPANLAAMTAAGPLAGGADAAVVPFLAREAAVNAGIQAVQEPAIQAGRAELGESHGVGQGLANILAAGAFGAGLGGLLRGAGIVYGRMVGRPRVALAPERTGAAPDLTEAPDAGIAAPGAEEEAPPQPAPLAAQPAEAAAAPDNTPIGGSSDGISVLAGVPADAAGLAPADFGAAAAYVERDAVMDAMSPDDSAQGRMESALATDDAAATIEAGDPLPAPAPAEPPAAEPAPITEPVAPVDAGTLAEPAPLGEPRARRRGSTYQPGSTTTSTGRPLSLAQYIARNGGLELNGDTRAAGFHQTFVPAGGPLARKSGLSIDEHWRHELIEAGYLRSEADGYHTRDIRDELFDALHQELIGSAKTFARRDEEEAARIAEAEDPYNREVEDHARTVRRAVGEDAHRTTVYEAAEMLMRGDADDPADAFERAAMMNADRLGEEPAAAYGGELPGWTDASAIQGDTARGDGRETGSEGGGADDAGPQEPDAGAGERLPHPGAAGEGAGSESAREGVAPSPAGPASEPTAAGDQTLIPGVAPVTTRQRLEALGARKLTGGDAAPGGLFDSAARDQLDLLDLARAARVTKALEHQDLALHLDATGDAVSARELLTRVKADKTAAIELADCIAREGL